MPGVPSNKACERCKKRHLKCDETRPHCQRCTNAGVECPGYVQTRKFIDQGASVRRRYAPYQESASKSTTPRSTDDSTKDHPPGLDQNAEKLSSSQAQSRDEMTNISAAFQVPPGLHSTGQESVHISSEEPMQQMQLDTIGHMTDRPVVPLISGAPSSGPSRSGSRTRGMQPSLTPGTVSLDSAQGNNVYQDFRPQPPSPGVGPPPSRSPSQRSEREEFQDIFSELMTGTRHEIAFLTRHFSDVLAAWLDLSDTGRFFGGYVPIRAKDEPSLQFAVAALSAKHLARMKGVKFASSSAMFTSPASTEIYPNSLQVDWFLKAANYYYLAVSRMNSSISDTYGTVSTTALLESPIEIVNRWLDIQLKESASASQDSPSRDTFLKKIENLLATSTILTLYKIIDEPAEMWQSHLAGVENLFNKIIESISATSENTPMFSHGVTAAFWNFARLDHSASYFNRLPTHFEPDNLTLWRAAGLPLDDHGIPLSPAHMTSAKLTFSPEDLAANILTWVLNKITNFLAATKKSQLEHWVGRPSSESASPASAGTPSPHPSPTTANWLKLSFELQSWVERIPETFRSCLRQEQPKTSSKSPENGGHVLFPEVYYSLTSCASAMQQYHFGRLALSLNRPSDEVSGPSTAFDRLQGYREVTKEVDYRCREICGIALGRPHSGARINMITLLFAVGQCLERQEERQIVVDLLRGIEADLGWATTPQVQKLQKLWDDRAQY